MKIPAFLFFCLISLPIASAYSQTAQKAPIPSTWSFYDIKLSDLVRVAFSELLNKPFIADDAFVNDPKKVTLDLKRVDPAQAVQYLTEVLNDAGYKTTDDNGVLKIRKLTQKDKDDEQETFIYTPRFRTVEYLINVLGLGRNRSSQPGANNNNVPGPGQDNNNQQQGRKSDSAAQYLDTTADVFYYKASHDSIQQIRAALENIDRPEDQIDVQAVIYEYQTGNTDNTAIGAVLNLASSKLTGQIGSVQSVGDFLSLNTNGLQLLFSALTEDKRFQLISSPTIRAKSGNMARINVGSDVPTLGATTTLNNGQVQQSVTYQKTGVTLELNPTILHDVINLNLRQSISEPVTTTTGVSGSPTLLSREMTTSIAIKDGETIVLGGLKSNRLTNNKSGQSWLPEFLHSKTRNDDHSELLLFIKVDRVKYKLNTS